MGVWAQGGPCSMASILANNSRVMTCDNGGDPYELRARKPGLSWIIAPKIDILLETVDT